MRPVFKSGGTIHSYSNPRMKNHLKILLVAGARPNFMKIAPVIHAIESINSNGSNGSTRIDYRLIHTGQHYDEKMSGVFFRELDMPEPDENLEVGSGTHAEQTARIMLSFEPVCLREKPDWVVVVGDVNSTMACAVVAAKLGIPVAHIEAGLRSFDRTMPEELNRLVTDAIADLLLTPSTDADENLLREGVSREKIRCVGNVMVDSLVEHLDQMGNCHTLERLGLEPGRFVYVTLHRPANVDNRENLEVIVRALADLSEQWTIIFPVHPRTLGNLRRLGLGFDDHPGVRLLEPIGYLDSLNLTRHARFLLTDSGGLQEESTYFHTPCLTLRPNTERPITIDLGSNRLTTIGTLRDDIANLLARPQRLGATPPLWDGRSAGRILGELLACAH